MPLFFNALHNVTCLGFPCRCVLQAPRGQLLAAIHDALAAVPRSEAAPLWLLALAMLRGCAAELARLQDALVAFLTGGQRGPAAGGMGLVAARWVSHTSAALFRLDYEFRLTR